MCGVAAAYPADLEFVQSVLASQTSRGPDDTASADLGWCVLGVNRLAISGLSGGEQPLHSADGETVVVFNGAIYNFEELCLEFGFEPKSANDGEVIHFLYDRFGLGFADYLEGMFAICIADVRKRKLVLAVDQVGIKPLYFIMREGRCLAASTPDAFPDEMRRLVARVPPGTVWTSEGEVRRLVYRRTVTSSLDSLLYGSVVEQIPKEVPWGCLLSGGVDSSLVTRIAADLRPGVPTFTCGSRDAPDLLNARELAKLLGTDHHEVLVDPDELVDVVDAVIRATASIEPWTIMGGVGTYLAAREARANGIKVLLSGEGADELFGGYDEFQSVPTAYLNARLVQYQVDLGATECLRLDRATMAHGVEARVPFLSNSIVRHARGLDASQKINRENVRTIRKYALRRCATKYLPKHMAYRDKAEFSYGSGLTPILRDIAGFAYSMQRVAEIQASFPTFAVTSPLEAWIVDRWSSIFGATLGERWDDMVQRGLYRQPVGPYLPVVDDPSIYAEGEMV